MDKEWKITRIKFPDKEILSIILQLLIKTTLQKWNYNRLLMDREVCNATNPIIKKLLITIKTSTPELLFLKIYSPYSEIYRNYQKTLKSTTTYD